MLPYLANGKNSTSYYYSPEMLVGVEHYFNSEYDKALVYVTMVTTVLLSCDQQVATRCCHEIPGGEVANNTG